MQEIKSSSSDVVANKPNALLPIFHFISLFVLVALYALPFIVDNTLWVKHFQDYSLVLDYVREHGMQLAPQISQGVYLDEYPLVFWALGAFVHFLPLLSNSFLLVSFFVASIFFFVFSVYMLASSLYYSSKVALSASCIAITSFFALGYIPFAGFDLFFVSFVNLSLAFAFRAYLRPIAPIFLFFAFVFMTFGFFSGGFFAFALRIFVSIIFLVLCGNFSRFRKGDGYVFTVSFLAVFIVAFLLFYTEGHREYVALLSDFDTFKNSLETWQFASHAIYYFLAVLCIFLPFIFILFFVDIPYILTPVIIAINVLRGIKVPEPIKRKLAKNKAANSNKETENEIEAENQTSFDEKQDINQENIPTQASDVNPIFESADEALENELDSENSYALLAKDEEPKKEAITVLEPEEVARNIVESNKVLAKELSEDEIKENKKKSRFASLFLFSILASGLILLCIFPVSTFTYVLFLAPAFSLFFARQVNKLTERASSIFYNLVAWLIILIGVATLACGMLPEWSLLYPELFATLPTTLAAVALTPSKGSFFFFGAIIITLAIIFLFTQKNNPQKTLTRLVLLLIVLSWGLNFVLYSQVQLENTKVQHVEEASQLALKNAN